MKLPEGYYAILDVHASESQDVSRAIERAQRLLSAGPSHLQLRAKAATAADMMMLGRALLPLTQSFGVSFCINDRLDVALALGADAVHLGQDDLPLADARRIVGDRMQLGISTHTAAQAADAIAAGADYIGFGPIFPTRTKADPDPVVGVALLASVAARARIPVVAIGGIALTNVAEIAGAGAAAVALISAMEAVADPVAAGQSVNAAFARSRRPRVI